MKKLAKPFSITTKKQREGGFLREQDIDDMLSEISTPDIDFSERKKILEQLEKREKLKEDIDLQNCLQSLTGKPLDLNSNDSDSVMSRSVSDMKQLKDKPNQINIYKPNFTQKMGTPRQQKQGQPVVVQHQNLFSEYVKKEQKQQKVQPKVKTLFDAEDPETNGGQRLEHIYGQLKELQAFKDEILNDLDDFMSEVESS